MINFYEYIQMATKIYTKENRYELPQVEEEGKGTGCRVEERV